MIENLDYDPSVDEESDYIHKDNLPDLDFAKEMLKSVKGAIYETGDIETLEDCLEELLATFDLKIPLHQPLLVKKESQMTKNTPKTYSNHFSKEDMKVIKDIIDPKAKFNDSQIKQFLYVCAEKNLDPRSRQIYALPKENFKTKEIQMSIQTSIDGFRIIAERTGKYAPGKPTHFMTDENKELVGATVFVKKYTEDGTWHEVAATAFLKEYKPKKYSTIWESMPSVMIEKCAEARALRRAFPEAFSGLYSDDEMDQAKPVETITQSKPAVVEQNITTIKHITPQQAKELDSLIGNDNKYRTSVLRVLKSVINKDSFEHMPLEMYEKVRKVALNNSEKTLEAKEA